ncbi:MAG: 3-phosphoshikimate 1-carboxyvinyltransferase [Phycisphaerae bacterium]
MNVLCEWIGPNVLMHPVGPLRGSARPPGSKSIANRLLICAALADGESVLRHAPDSDDVARMCAALGSLGIAASGDRARGEIRVIGCGGHIPGTSGRIDAGDAGTVMRFVTALACLGHGGYMLDGSPRMRKRPIGPLVDALMQLGVGIGYAGEMGFPPLNVAARGLTGGRVVLDAEVSSQFLSALLMIGPYARQDLLIELNGPLVSRPYVDLTISCMRSMGVDALNSECGRFVVPAWQRYAGREIEIEPDASGACYLWAAGAMTGGEVFVSGLTRASRQGDVRFIDVLAHMGCQVREREGGIAVSAPRNGRLEAVDVILADIPDQAPTLAALAALADGPTRIRGVAHLQHKESDRLNALASELGQIGARVRCFDDGLEITPPKSIQAARLESHGDHRIAMGLSLIGLVVEGIEILGAECVRKSFPGFFEVLSMLAT